MLRHLKVKRQTFRARRRYIPRHPVRIFAEPRIRAEKLDGIWFVAYSSTPPRPGGRLQPHLSGIRAGQAKGQYPAKNERSKERGPGAAHFASTWTLATSLCTRSPRRVELGSSSHGEWTRGCSGGRRARPRMAGAGVTCAHTPPTSCRIDSPSGSRPTCNLAQS